MRVSLTVALAMSVACRIGFDLEGGNTDTDAGADSSLAPFDGCVPGEDRCDWQRRAQITIASGSPVQLSDVPVPVILTEQNFDFAVAQASGGDIRFGSADGSVQLPFEVDEYSTSNAVLWVRLPILEPTGASILLYSGNAGASAPAFSDSVFDDDYVGVWHLGDGSEDEQLDASVYENHGTPFGTVSSEVGILSAAAAFDGASFVDVGADSELELTTTGTLSAWVKFDSLTMFATPVAKTEFGDTPNYSYGFQRDGENSGAMAIKLSNGIDATEAQSSITNIELDRWYHFAARWDGTEAVMLVDGARSGAPVAQITPQTNVDHRVTIGCAYSPSCTSDAGIDGLVDEVRISRIPRSDAWIAAQVSMARGGVTVGAPEPAR